MASKSATKGALFVRAYVGDAKTLLAFNLNKPATKNLAGFTIGYDIKNEPTCYLLNSLQFEKPSDHAQNTQLPPTSSFNAPFHKFRWLHVPGSANQGVKPFYGKYTYIVTPRYFDNSQSLMPLDSTLSVSVTVDVLPFVKKNLSVGFTRGFVQSQAYVRHYGPKAVISPADDELFFDTTEQAGVDPTGQPFTFEEEYEWLGFTARDRVFEILDEVLAKPSLRLDVFAYDLNEPDVCKKLIKIAKQGRLRIVLDNASLHKTSAKKTAAEDEFEKLLPKAKTKEEKDRIILRKHFARYSHDKVFIVSRGQKALKVLTGSTNLSITGLYVNSNHVLVYDDETVAAKYAEMFNTVWSQQASAAKFIATDLSNKEFSFTGVPDTKVTFSPHDETHAKKVLDDIVTRVGKEDKKSKTQGSVLFALMVLKTGTGPVYPALQKLHANQNIFSYGISDSPDGIFLYKPKTKRGILVTGKPGKSQLPKPFNQVPGISGHQIHHKFVVCGFNGSDPTVYCGSSNLALGGEEENGDNLITIRDEDVATVFAIEAMALVDHFHFLNTAAEKSGKKTALPKASKSQQAVDANWFLGTTNKWVEPYYDAADIHQADRILFA